MSFIAGKRTGRNWSDFEKLDKYIKQQMTWNQSFKTERDIEIAFTNCVLGRKDEINGSIISQVDNDTKIASVDVFSHKSRPDLTINDDGIAIEIKFFNGKTYSFKEALGQS